MAIRAFGASRGIAPTALPQSRRSLGPSERPGAWDTGPVGIRCWVGNGPRYGSAKVGGCQGGGDGMDHSRVIVATHDTTVVLLVQVVPVHRSTAPLHRRSWVPTAQQHACTSTTTNRWPRSDAVQRAIGRPSPLHPFVPLCVYSVRLSPALPIGLGRTVRSRGAQGTPLVFAGCRSKWERG